MTEDKAIFSRETFRFFRDLEKNNRKEWMHENRDRYEAHIVAPFRRLLEALTPAVKKLNPASLTSEPLPVYEVSSRQFDHHVRPGEPLDRFTIEFLRDSALDQQRTGASFDAECPIGATRVCPVGQSLQRG